MKLAGLHIYPVKSCRGIELKQAMVLPRGLEHDRRWMIVDASGRFISQRSHPKLAQLIVTPDAFGLDLAFGDKQVRANIPIGKRVDVTVWRSNVNALIADEAINANLSDWFGEALRLVYMDQTAVRPTSPDWAKGHETSFSDGYPVLVTNTASLGVINDFIKDAGHDPVGMARFRPNVVIDTDQAWAEDGWTSLRIGEVVLDLVKPCTRCLVTTLDPLTGERRAEPVLKALNRLRMSEDPRNKGVLFGVNAVVRWSGLVRIGQDVEPF